MSSPPGYLYRRSSSPRDRMLRSRLPQHDFHGTISPLVKDRALSFRLYCDALADGCAEFDRAAAESLILPAIAV